jgi:hypothetical protein
MLQPTTDTLRGDDVGALSLLLTLRTLARSRAAMQLEILALRLLRNSFYPSADIRVIRTYWRQRADHVGAVSTCIQRRQKALTQMNIQLANVISDLSGWTGMRIVRAILAGERDPHALAALSHPGIQASRDTIAKSLEGTWRVDLLFVLQQEVATYDAYLHRIAECDHALEQHLLSLTDKVDDNGDLPLASAAAHRQAHPKRRRKAGSHTPQFDLGRELQRISGVDLTRLDGSMSASRRPSSAKSDSTCRAGRTSTTSPPGLDCVPIIGSPEGE